MFHTQMIRSALLFVVVIAALTTASGALGSSAAGKPGADWFERNVAAHPFGHAAFQSAALTPDWFERAAAHPSGEGVLDSSRTARPRPTRVTPKPKPAAVFLIDDWFRDQVTATHARRKAVKVQTVYVADDWFRDENRK
jgi:hypothetical protein